MDPQRTLVALAQKRFQALDHLLHLAQEQKKLVEQGEVESLLELLQGPKHRALVHWERIERQWKTLAQAPQWENPDLENQYRHWVREANERLGQLVQLEQQCQQLMQQRRQQIQQLLLQVQDAQQAAQAYTQTQQGPAQLDLLSEG